MRPVPPAITKRLESEFHVGLYRRTLSSILSRIEPSGYFGESLTGRYPGMFPRTIGALAKLLLLVGRPAEAEAALGYVLQATADAGMLRIPHVILAPEPDGRKPIYCRHDEIDGQAHIILGWALVALARGRTTFEDQWYDFVAALLDRTTDWPYLAPYGGEKTGRTQLGLVRNVCLEHSREGRYWDAYDILTQGFVCAALAQMAELAARRGDTGHANQWSATLAALEKRIADRLTRELDGARVYLEMWLPDGGAGQPFEGLGWLNLGPVAAEWQGLDPVVMANTMAAYRQRAIMGWQGLPVLLCDWWPDRPATPMVIGKALGWEMVWGLQAGEWARIGQVLDLIRRINTADLFMESATYDPTSDRWLVGDAGNGEQTVWYCWAMAKLRQAAGL